MLSTFANPARFMALSRWLAPLFYAVGGALIAYCLYQGIYVVPPIERQGGDIARNLQAHVPVAYIATIGYYSMAAASFVWFIWRHELADMAAKSMAPLGLAYTIAALASGSIWGQGTWGTWWAWDARLTATLFMAFLYLGYIFLRLAMESRQKAARAGAILTMLGVPIVIMIKFSVDMFLTLHQGASILTAEGPKIPWVHLRPMFAGMAGHMLVFSAMTMTLMRADIYKRQAARWREKRLAGAR